MFFGDFFFMLLTYYKKYSISFFMNETGIIKSGVLQYSRVQIIRRSKRTGGLTVKLLEDRNPYKKGDIVNINPYEFQGDIVNINPYEFQGDIDKTVYIRFFENRVGDMPVNSDRVGSTKKMPHMNKNDSIDLMNRIFDWMLNNPNGKVDFVLL